MISQESSSAVRIVSGLLLGMILVGYASASQIPSITVDFWLTYEDHKPIPKGTSTDLSQPIFVYLKAQGSGGLLVGKVRWYGDGTGFSQVDRGRTERVSGQEEFFFQMPLLGITKAGEYRLCAEAWSTTNRRTARCRFIAFSGEAEIKSQSTLITPVAQNNAELTERKQQSDANITPYMPKELTVRHGKSQFLSSDDLLDKFAAMFGVPTGGFGEPKYQKATGKICYADGYCIQGNNSDGSPAVIESNGSIVYNDGGRSWRDKKWGTVVVNTPDGLTKVYDKNGQLVYKHDSITNKSLMKRGNAWVDAKPLENRAVTSRDFGTIAVPSPGTSVARSTALPSVRSTADGESDQVGGNTMALARDSVGLPRLDERFLQFVWPDGYKIQAIGRDGSMGRIQPDGSIRWEDSTVASRNDIGGHDVEYPSGTLDTYDRQGRLVGRLAGEGSGDVQSMPSYGEAQQDYDTPKYDPSKDEFVYSDGYSFNAVGRDGSKGEIQADGSIRWANGDVAQRNEVTGGHEIEYQNGTRLLYDEIGNYLGTLPGEGSGDIGVRPNYDEPVQEQERPKFDETTGEIVYPDGYSFKAEGRDGSIGEIQSDGSVLWANGDRADRDGRPNSQGGHGVISADGETFIYDKYGQLVEMRGGDKPEDASASTPSSSETMDDSASGSGRGVIGSKNRKPGKYPLLNGGMLIVNEDGNIKVVTADGTIITPETGTRPMLIQPAKKPPIPEELQAQGVGCKDKETLAAVKAWLLSKDEYSKCHYKCKADCWCSYNKGKPNVNRSATIAECVEYLNMTLNKGSICAELRKKERLPTAREAIGGICSTKCQSRCGVKRSGSK